MDHSCKAHDWEWAEGDPGCPWCLKLQVEELKQRIEWAKDLCNHFMVTLWPEEEQQNAAKFILRRLTGEDAPHESEKRKPSCACPYKKDSSVVDHQTWCSLKKEGV